MTLCLLGIGPVKQSFFNVKLRSFPYPSVKTCVLVAQKTCLIETVLMSTHNICFGWEIRKIFFNYTLLSGGLAKGVLSAYNLCKQFEPRSGLTSLWIKTVWHPDSVPAKVISRWHNSPQLLSLHRSLLKSMYLERGKVASYQICLRMKPELYIFIWALTDKQYCCWWGHTFLLSSYCTVIYFY